MCLVKDPSRRPSAEKLLKHVFFKQAKAPDFLVKHLLDGLPPLEDRVRTLKVTTATTHPSPSPPSTAPLPVSCARSAHSSCALHTVTARGCALW